MSGGAPAGWYDDPVATGVARYWDGNSWTDHTSPRSEAAPDEVGQPNPRNVVEGRTDGKSGSEHDRGAIVAGEPEDHERAQIEPRREDVAVALRAMKVTSRVKRELRSLGEYLKPDEQVLRMAIGLRSQQRGILVLTDRRLFFLWQGMIRHSSESIPLDLMTGAALNRGLIFSSIKTQGAQSMEIVGQIDKSDAQALVEDLRALIGRRGMATASHPDSDVRTGLTAAETDPIAALQTLKQMMELQLISEDEYRSKKAELLARM